MPMLLTSINYSEHEGQEQEWVLEDLSLGSRNLLVGKNATGKTRVLNIIGALAQLLRAERPPTLLSANYNVCFADGGKRLTYSFRAEEEKVVTETFAVDGRTLLRRGAGGAGTIFAQQIQGGMEVEFQTPQNELAAVVRRDAIQHAFLEPLYEWASGVRHYYFGTPLGKDNFAVFLPKGGAVPDDKDASQVVAIYRKAMKELGDSFKEAMLRDMERADYPLVDIGVGPPVSIRVTTVLPGELVGLWVRERGLRAVTDQHTMSQGMSRVLSLLTIINYLTLATKAGCILIDDIGEGLDFVRSCLLVDLLREKAERSSIQLVLSTNDKFVMNKVPLEEWSVLQRQGSHLRVRNRENSRELFEEFKFTGLSNFAFLEMDFVNGAPEEEAVAHE
jgi:hypothetical protein